MAAKQRLLCYEAMTYMQALYRPRCIMFLITISQDGSEYTENAANCYCYKSLKT